MERFEAISKELKNILSEHRYEHTMGVVEVSASLAATFGCDVDRAKLAALLHDCAKSYPAAIQLRKCNEYNVELSEVEENNTELVHAKLGAVLARELYEVDDEEISEAIKWHTTGKPEMALLEKIIFVADYIEPGRNKAPNLEKIRKVVYEDIDDAVYYIMRDTLYYLYMNSPFNIDDMTKKAFDYYKGLFKTKHDKEEI